MSEMTEHWTDDEDLLERFVRGDDDAIDAAALRAHLGSCGRCRARVEEELAMRLAVRAEGREVLRKKVHEAAAPSRRGEVLPWQWVAVAAILVVALAVWRLPGLRREGPEHELDEAPRPPAMTDSGSHHAERAADGEGRAGAGVATPAPLVERRRGERLDGGITLGQSGVRIVAEPSSLASSAEAGAAKEDGTPTRKSKERFWATAMDISSAPTTGVTSRDEVQQRMAVQQQKKAGPRTQAAQAIQQRWRLVPGSATYGGPVTNLVEYSDAPTAGHGVAIPVMLMKKGDSLEVTMYGATVLKDLPWTGATMTAPTPDSLLIVVGEAIFGLRLPSGMIVR